MKISKLWVSLSLMAIGSTYFSSLGASNGDLFPVFTLVSFALLYSIKIGSISWFYTFFSVFFFLGCWLKVAVHHIFEYPYIEASGNFSGTNSEWNSYYIATSCLAIGIMTGKILWMLITSRKQKTHRLWIKAKPVHPHTWFAMLFLSITFYAINSYFAFFVTGINPRLSLPFGLNAPIAFIAFIGLPLIFSTFFSKDIAARGNIKSTSLIAILIMIGLASVSMASRAAIVMQAIPILFAAAYVVSKGNSVGIKKAPFVYFGVFLTLVLVLVSAFRVIVFSGGSLSDTSLLINIALETIFLVVDRWVGAEAIMTAISEPSSSIELAYRMTVESPTTGVDSIYQKLAGSKYEFLNEFTFLTLPGFFGIVSFSGSPVAAMILTMGVTFFGIFYEQFIRFTLFNQSISVALAATAVANAIAQMNFPLLFLPFIFQLTAFLVIIHLILSLQISRPKSARVQIKSAKQVPRIN